MKEIKGFSFPFNDLQRRDQMNCMHRLMPELNQEVSESTKKSVSCSVQPPGVSVTGKNDTLVFKDFDVSPVSKHFLYSRNFLVSPVSRPFLYSRDLVVSPVSRHFPLSRNFVVSPVSRHFLYSSDFVVFPVSRHFIVFQSV